MPLWSAGNFRVVLCRGDGSEAGRLISYPTVIAAHRQVLPDSRYGVGDSFGPGSRGSSASVSHLFQGRAHPRAASLCYNSWS